jgi:hypothetical protein
MPSCFQPAIPSTHLPPVRHIVVVDSDTESESGCSYPNNDEESVPMIENQAGYPFTNSPPPASNNVGHALNNNGEFFLKERCVQTELSVS